MKSVNHKGERNVIGDVLHPTIGPTPLGNDIAYAATGFDAGVERRILPFTPHECDVPKDQTAMRSKELKRHRRRNIQRADQDNADHGVDILGKVSAIQKGPCTAVVPRIRVPTVGSEGRVFGDQYLSLRMTLLEQGKGL